MYVLVHYVSDQINKYYYILMLLRNFLILLISYPTGLAFILQFTKLRFCKLYRRAAVGLSDTSANAYKASNSISMKIVPMGGKHQT